MNTATTNPMADPKENATFSWSSDEETFNDDTLEELLQRLHDSGEELVAGRVVYYGTPRRFRAFDLLNVDSVIDDMANCAGDEGGEWADDYPSVTDEQRTELEALLEAWCDKLEQPTFWRIEDSKPYTVTEEDLANVSR